MRDATTSGHAREPACDQSNYNPVPPPVPWSCDKASGSSSREIRESSASAAPSDRCLSRTSGAMCVHADTRNRGRKGAAASLAERDRARIIPRCLGRSSYPPSSAAVVASPGIVCARCGTMGSHRTNGHRSARLPPRGGGGGRGYIRGFGGAHETNALKRDGSRFFRYAARSWRAFSVSLPVFLLRSLSPSLSLSLSLSVSLAIRPFRSFCRNGEKSFFEIPAARPLCDGRFDTNRIAPPFSLPRFARVTRE